MNERILQFAIEAGMYVDLNGKPWPKWMGAEECELAYARFAELIVKECADFLKDKLDDHFAAEQLEEHFGVEE
jgi:hypothetical protein